VRAGELALVLANASRACLSINKQRHAQITTKVQHGQVWGVRVQGRS